MQERLPESPAPSFLARHRFRLLSIGLLAAVTLIQVLVLALMNKNFDLRKKEIIADKKKPLVEIQSRMRMINPRMLKEIRTPGSIPGEEMAEHVRQAYHEGITLISQPDFPAVRMEIANEAGEVVYRFEPANADAKRKRFNTWRNCLFSREFEYPARGTFYGYELRVYLVSWPGLPEVEELVLLHRGYAFLFTLANILIALLIYTGAIRPLARIAHALSNPGTGPPPIIPHPRDRVERSYNSMARSARLTSVHSGLSDLWEQMGEGDLEDLSTQASFWNLALGIICQGMGYRTTAWFPLTLEGPSDRPLAVSLGIGSPFPLPSIREAGDHLAEGGPEGRVLYQSTQDGPLHEKPAGPKDHLWLAGVILRRQEWAGMLLAAPSSAGEMTEASLPYFRSLLKQLGMILTRSQERLETLDRGRYEVSIDLSASMGHDLTNILATGKLELETLGTAFKKGIVQVPEEKKKPVLAAVEGLRKTTVLLQEVVDVYRAFSYTREPHFEMVELKAIAREVIDLYRHSTSRRVFYDLIGDSKPVRTFADPRLLKLVLFNLLANATQAIAERQRERPDPPGRVEVTCQEEEDWATLCVTDNGTGFQNRKGHRLEGVELQQIFHFDFTTKHRQGGLGLAWVRSIITDIHQGRLLPSNRDEGEGAKMEVRLPLHPGTP
jgi:signal transduction histidine kinase